MAKKEQQVKIFGEIIAYLRNYLQKIGQFKKSAGGGGSFGKVGVCIGSQFKRKSHTSKGKP